ncbi:MAG: ATP-grasp domain-containing protein [Candidatus Methanoperedens sp.]|nr:ATP-grasp domain-containing protein [Candidatus Methanoperedens sp.]
MKFLVIGNSTRGIVCSAKRAGHKVFSIDNFCDVDLKLCANAASPLENVTEGMIYELALTFGEIDGVILGTGFERLKFKNVLGNRIEVSEEVNDKLKLAKKLQALGIPHPETEELSKAGGLKFPLMIKPRCGSGGMRNYTVHHDDELAAIQSRPDAREFIAQEFVEGVPCSASLIGTGEKASVIALNEQLIGIPSLTRLPFAYCGNVTPFITQFKNEMIEYSEQIALEFGLMGSNGVDLIQTEKGVVVIEVNPRFQGSLDTVELSCGINVFDAHVRSFSGELPKPGQHKRFAVRNILYADKSIRVNERLFNRLIKCMKRQRAADIPEKGWTAREDEPLSTLLETGGTREMALEKVEKSARYIRGLTEV